VLSFILPSRHIDSWFLSIINSPDGLLFRFHLPYLISNLSRVDDELEWIKFLVLLHQLQVGEPFDLMQGLAFGESAPGPFERSCCQLELPFRDHLLCGLEQLSLRHVKVVDQHGFPVGPAQIINTLEIRLPIADILVIGAIDDVFPHEQKWQVGVGIASEQSWGNEIGLLNRCAFIPSPNRPRNCFRYLAISSKKAD
jgi:hypothetical protein